MRIQYQECDMNDVMSYFVKGFNLPEDEMWKYDWFYDPNKGRVIFKLYLNDKKEE